MATAGAAKPVKKKSGLITLKSGEKLFNDSDPAQSLYIIQSGQVRLFKPKGQGFIELAVLRSGEVLGEMAFFDEKGGRRSCSAEAIVETQVIEVSFAAFGKAIDNLNPWFQTIVTTLANRLRKTNAKVKQLETNSVTGGYGESAKEYTFLMNVDVVKLLSVFFLVFKSHGEIKDDAHTVHRTTLNLYLEQIFNITEVKAEAFMTILQELDYLKITNDKDGHPKILHASDLATMRQLLIFFNAERSTVDEKKLRISHKCELFLDRILKQIKDKGFQGDRVDVSLKPILAEFKERNVIIDEDDLADAIEQGLVGEPIVGKTNDITCSVNLAALNKVFPAVKFQNEVKKLNKSKSKS